MKRAVLFASILYLGSLLTILAAMKIDDSSVWPMTLFLLSPRWLVATPLIVLVPITFVVCARWTMIHLVSAAVISVPIMGFQFATSVETNSGASNVLRVVTSNMGGAEPHAQQLIDLVVNDQVDVLMLQECPPSISEPLFAKLGWQHQQRYNMAIGSRLALGDATILAGHSTDSYRDVAAMSCNLHWPDNGDIRLVSVHLPTFRRGLEKVLRLDVGQLPSVTLEMGIKHRAIAGMVHRALEKSKAPVVIAGDFNVPIESIYYREFWNDYRNSYSEQGRGLGYTKHTRFHGVRIDHILADDHWTVLKSSVGNSLGGDHRPVIAELAKAKTP